MASYENRKGDRIEVDDKHIETAITLKLELQKESPSGKCSWVRHKKMMEREGYDDSDKNENYRQLIKKEQKKRGQLPTVETYADMTADKKLESIKESIGEMYISKRANQNANRELNKVKREITDNMLFLEDIKEHISKMDFGNGNTDYIVLEKEENSKRMIACLSDIHYGSVVDIEGRVYNTELSAKFILDYADKIISIAKKEKVSVIDVVNLGDLVEHSSMRPQNTYSIEKLLSEQVTEVTDIIILFLKKLSKHFKITYSAIAGNHDRIVGNKNNSLFGEHVVTVSNKIIETFIKYSGEPNIEYIPTESYHHIISVGEKNFLFVHGDITSLKQDSVLAQQSALFDINFDAIIGGHIHHFTTREVSEDRYITTFGSIKGTDDFSLKIIHSSASRSQGIILIDDNGEFEIKQVKL